MLEKSKRTLDSFKNKSVETINSKGGANGIRLLCATVKWDKFFNGSLFDGGGVDEFDKCNDKANVLS